jgi:Ca2+-binding EF-hand superfamily protein
MKTPIWGKASVQEAEDQVTDAARPRPMEVMVALSEFRRWCVDTFPDAETAWNALNSTGHGCINQDDFRTALQRFNYPAGEAAMQKVFTSIQQNAVVTEQAFYAALDSVNVRRTQMPQKSDSETPSHGSHGEQTLTSDMDPMEAQALGNGQPNHIASIIERLRRTDAPVAELIEYLFGHFGTLKLAFRQLDLNGNGMLSTQEFADGLVRLKSKQGAGPVQAHMQQLFKRLDYASKGSMPLEDLVQNLESDSDTMITRLLKFTREVHKRTRSDSAHMGDPQDKKMRRYVSLFKVGHATSPVTPENFIFALEQLKYPAWHAVELFRRLDKDDSGNLSLAEFTAFLSKDPPVRRERKDRAVTPLGDDLRQQQVQQMYISSDHSCKLDASFHKKSASGTSLHRLMGRSDANSNKLLLTGLQRSPDGGVVRPDWLESVETGLLDMRQDPFKPKISELSRTGSHVLRAHAEPIRDLLAVGSGLANFNDKVERCRITCF